MATPMIHNDLDTAYETLATVLPMRRLIELDILVREIVSCSAAATKASRILLCNTDDVSVDETISVPATSVASMVEALKACNAAAQVALDHFSQHDTSLARSRTEGPAGQGEGVNVPIDGTVPEPIDAIHATGVYPTEEELDSIEATPVDVVPTFEPELHLEPLNHLLFVIHGIGEHADFQDGNWHDTPDLVGEYPIFRDLMRTTRDAFFSDIPLALEVQSIEWHSELHATGVDPVFDMIAPDGSDKIRQFNKRAFMDLLYYTAPRFAQLITDSVTNQLNDKYEAFVNQHPGWDGRVSIFAHSLGTIIAYDILTHGAGDVSANNVRYSGLKFPVETLFCAGSPVPVMVLSRGEVNLGSDGTFKEGIKAPNVTNRYINIFHPLDPIAYRVEPLFHQHMSHLPPVQLVSADAVKSRSLAELMSLYDAIDPDQTRQDFALRRQPREGVIDLAYAPFSHSSYWTSEDTVLFTLFQLCKPVVDEIRRYVQAGRDVPQLLPRYLAKFSPHKCPRFAIAASVRDATTGGWSSKAVFLGRRHVYVVDSARDVACTILWSIPLTAGVMTVEAVESDPLAFKVVPDRGSKFSYLPPNSSASAPQLIKAPTQNIRDDWVHAIETALVKQDQNAYELKTPDLGLPSGASVAYFGATKTGQLGYMWGRKWFVLTQTTFDCYDNVPAVDKWVQYPLNRVFMSAEFGHFRFLHPSGAALSVKISHHPTFTQWAQAIRNTAGCAVVENDAP